MPYGHEIPLGRAAASTSLPPELKILLNEFANNSWQFDATRIARMLSPTVILPSELADTAYSLLKEESSEWPRGTEDSPFYKPLVDFLNSLLAAAHRALDLTDPPIIERDERWYRGLRFVQLGDGSCEAHGRDAGPIKREAVGGISFREGSVQTEFAIPVKLDEDWPAVVAQALRSAHILYSASQLRKFALIIGFRRPTLELRFLIVHRGGVTASKPLSVVEERGKKGILGIFLSLLMWRTEEDAGIMDYSSDGIRAAFAA